MYFDIYMFMDSLFYHGDIVFYHFMCRCWPL